MIKDGRLDGLIQTKQYLNWKGLYFKVLLKSHPDLIDASEKDKNNLNHRIKKLNENLENSNKRVAESQKMIDNRNAAIKIRDAKISEMKKKNERLTKIRDDAEFELQKLNEKSIDMKKKKSQLENEEFVLRGEKE